MNIDNLTYKEIKEIVNMFGNVTKNNQQQSTNHPMLGKRCIVRTYSAGVHIGKVVWINPNNSMECMLEDALRLWRWEDSGLSLSAVSNNGIKSGKLNYTDTVTLTCAIEFIPTTEKAEETYKKFIEDKE